MDTIKTRFQASEHKSYAPVVKDIFKDGPVKACNNLFAGYSAWGSRAIIAHGASFYAIAKIRQLMGHQE